MHSQIDIELPAELLARFRRKFCDCLRAPFRGEIWENVAGVGMGRGLSNEGKPFDIGTACYLKPIHRELRARPYGKFVIMAAVQMLKTHGCIEMPAGYFIPHDPGDMGIYFSGDNSAFDQAKARTMPFLKSIPYVGQVIREVEENNRFDITTAEFYLPGMALRIMPLNESTTQRLTLRYVLISDAFLSGRTGLIDQAIRRTTQHNTKTIKDYKIIIESQGGEKGDDFDLQWQSTDQRLLHVVCPLCAVGQPFDWTRRRPDDFVATPPKGIVSLEHEAWLNFHTPILKRRDAGMQRGPEELVKLSDGSFNAREVMRQTYYECFHCGSAWRDTVETRQQLDESSYYVPSNPSANPENVGFSWPSWAGQRLPWGGEQNMLGYLEAKQVLDRFGNVEKLRQWNQKSAARPWDPNFGKQKVIEISIGSYESDPSKLIENFHSRNMTVDSQKAKDAGPQEDRVGTFWYVIRDWDKSGNSVQVARGFAESWDQLLKIMMHWRLVNQRFCIDASKWGPEIEAMAAAHFELVKPLVPDPRTGQIGAEYPSCWRLFYGDKRAEFKIEVNGKAMPSPVSSGQPSRMYTVNRNGRTWRFYLFKYRWSNIAFEKQLDALLSKAIGMPRFEALPREGLRLPNGQPDLVTLAKETGVLTFDQQMTARYVTKVRGVDKYEDIDNREAHYRDCELQQLVRASQDGLLGHVAEVVLADGHSG